MRAACWFLPLWLTQCGLVNGAVADQQVVDAVAIDPETFAALMEFVGDWQRYEGEWIDAMSLDGPDEQGEKSPQGEDDEQQDSE